MVTHWAGDTSTGPSSSTRVHGWDALTKKMLVVNFSPNGASAVERYELVSDKVDEGEITGINAEGKPRKATARTVREKPDYFTWTVKEDGEVVVSKFTRIKK